VVRPRATPRRVARVGAVAAAALLAGALPAACGLLVGDPHGLLPDDASAPDEASGRPDVATASDARGTADGGPSSMDGAASSDASAAADGRGDAGAPGPDGPVVCDAALDADPHNCGWCGHDCLGSTCSGGSCAQQVVFTDYATSMATDGPVLYYTAGAGIWTYDVSAGARQIVTSQNAPLHITVHPPYVYWVTADGLIHRALEDGGAPAAIASGPQVDCLAANSSKVYWWNGQRGVVYSVPVNSDGGATPATEYSATGPAPGCVAADDRYLALLTGQGLVQRDLDSGVGPMVVLPGPDTRYLFLAGAYAVAMSSTADDAGTTLHVNAIATGTTTVREVATFPWTNVLAMGADGAGIYWSPQNEARINGCSDVLCSAGVRHFSPTDVAFAPTVLALAPAWLYVSRTGAGTTFEVAR
jgi:hypothetical protein